MAFLLLLAAVPALSEIRSDQALTPAVIGAAASNQEFARVATDGTNFFAVWRTRAPANKIIIGGGRLSPSGELLDQPSILIASGPAATLGLPDVVFVGGIFLVAYPSGTSVVTRRFFRNGEPVDSQPGVIANCAMPMGLTTNGHTVFLATAPNRFLLLAANGTPLGAERKIPNAGTFSCSVNYGTGTCSVTSNGDRYLIAYAGESSYPGVFVLLSPDGDFVAAKPIPGQYQVTVTATSNGSSFLIVVAYEVGGRGVFCMAADVDGNAGALHQVATPIYRTPVVATSRGNEYVLFWNGQAAANGVLATFGERVDATGLPIDNMPVIVAPTVWGPGGGLPLRLLQVFASASNGQDTIVITGNSGYYDNNDWRTEAAIFRSLPQIDSEPVNRRHAAIASSAAEQAAGSIASNGASSLVTWRERSGFNQTLVRAALIDANGHAGPPIEIGEASARTPTATASNGRDFLISYIDPNSMLVARRVSLEGVVDPKPIRLFFLQTDSFNPNQIAIGWSGVVYLVMKTGDEGTAFSAVLPATGQAFLLSGTCGVSSRQLTVADTPAIQCGASGCTVTWRTTIFPSVGETSAYQTNTLCFADAYGRPLSSVEIAEGTTPALSMPPFNGKALFVYSTGKSMFAGRITSGGVVLDPPAFDGGVRVMTSETAFPLQPAAVVYNGLYFVQPDSTTSGRLYWTRIEPEPAPHVASLVNLHETVTLPVTLTASARNTYLVYSRGEDDEKLMAPRLFLRSLASPDPQPVPVRRHAAH